MSIRLMSQVWELQLPKAQKLVLLALADHAHDDGTSARPGVEFVAWKTDLDRRTVQRALRELETGELIEPVAPRGQDDPKKGGSGRPTAYLLHLDKGVKKPPFERRGGTTPPPQENSGSVTPLPEKGGAVPEKGGTTSQKSGAAPPEPYEPPGTTPSPAAPAGRGPRDPVWDGFIEAIHAEPATRKEQSRWRGAAKEIRDALKVEWDLEIKTRIPTADPLYARIRLEVRRRAQRYRRQHPEWAFTETALASRWGELGDPAEAPPLPSDEPDTPAAETLENRRRTSIARVKALGNRPGALQRMLQTWEGITCPDCDEFLATPADAFEHPDHQLQEVASG